MEELEERWQIDLGTGTYRLAITKAADGIIDPLSVVGWFSAGREEAGSELSRLLDRRAHYRAERAADCAEVRVALRDGDDVSLHHFTFSVGEGPAGAWRLSGQDRGSGTISVAAEYVAGPGPGWLRRRTIVRNQGPDDVLIAAAASCRTTLLPGIWKVFSPLWDLG
jgi:hypothetical protein